MALAQEAAAPDPEPTVIAPAAPPDPEPAAPPAGTSQPATPRPSRLNVYAKKLVGFQAFLETVPGTAFDEARNFPHDWGRGLPGIGRRFASQYGQFVLSETMALGIGAITHEDPVFHRQGTGTIGSRVKHVMGRSFVAPTTSGGRTVAFSTFAGTYGAWAIATRWNPPDQRNLRSVGLYGTLGLGLKMGGNAFNEFWPDAKRLLKRKKR